MSSEDTVAQEFDRLRGRLCGLIESWGLDDRQERGAIQTLKTLSYASEGIVKEIVEDAEERAKGVEFLVQQELDRLEQEKTP